MIHQINTPKPTKAKYGGKRIYSSRDEYGVLEVIDYPNQRCLHFGSSVAQSAIIPDNPDTIIFEYIQKMLLNVEEAVQGSALLLGLGGGNLAKALLSLTELKLVSIELRSELIFIAEHYFSLPSSPRLTHYIADACQAIQNNLNHSQSSPWLLESYNFIFIDVYDDQGSVKTCYSTEFFDGIKKLLSPQGKVIINSWVENWDDYLELTENLTAAFDCEFKTINVKESANRIICLSLN